MSKYDIIQCYKIIIEVNIQNTLFSYSELEVHTQSPHLMKLEKTIIHDSIIKQMHKLKRYRSKGIYYEWKRSLSRIKGDIIRSSPMVL